MFGDIVKVTPSSKVVGDMALMMVSQGLTRADVEDPKKDVSFPESVVDMMRGYLGQPPGGWPKAIQKKILKGETPLTERPGKSLKPVDIETTRKDVSKELEGFKVDDEDLNGYLMYPKVYLDYMGRHRIYGPVRTLPTDVFFYGMEPGDEVSVEIDPGKTLEIRLQTVGEIHEDGSVRVFFELNGQPRVIRVQNRKTAAAKAAHPKAEAGNPAHLGAPMPGVVASVAVQPGNPVKEGDLLLSIEAMKMETGLHAERDAVVKAVHVGPGSQIDAKGPADRIRMTAAGTVLAPDTAKVLAIADLHLTAGRARIIGLDPWARFEAVLSRALGEHGDAALLVLMGDLAHRGEAEVYARLAARLSRVSVPVVPMLGNHDRREPFRAAFPLAPAGPGDFVQTARDAGPARILTLDTLDGPPYPAGHHAGRLCPARLEWLDRELGAAADRPVVVCLHHPPVAVGLPGMDRIALADPAPLLDRLHRHGRAHLVAGHIHRTISGSTRGVPWTILKSPCHQAPLDLAAPDSSLSIDEAGAYGLLLLSAEGVVVHSEDATLPRRDAGRDPASA